MNEQSAFRSLQKGSQDGLVWFIEHYSNYVGTIIMRILGNHMTEQDAEEVVSDVFLALWKQADRIQTDNIKAYLGRMARNMALNKFRELGLTLPLEEDRIQVDTSTPEGELLKKEAAEIVTREVKKMKEPEREILLRYYYYFESVEQIAERLRMNPATVKTKLFRARKRLKDILQDELR